jgi:thiol-disulfide isomerase/thioredoxin
MADSAFANSNQSEQQLLGPDRQRPQLWPWIGLALVMLVVFLTRGWWQPARQPPGKTHPAVNTTLTTFRLQPLTGDARELEITDLDGKVTLVNFWGPWCGACAVEFPRLVEIEQHFRSRPEFQFVSVSSNFDPFDEQGLAESTADFLKRHKANFPTYRDPQAHTLRALVTDLKLENFGYPTTLLIGPDRKVRSIWTGYSPGDEKDVQQSVEKALAELDARPKTSES